MVKLGGVFLVSPLLCDHSCANPSLQPGWPTSSGDDQFVSTVDSVVPRSSEQIEVTPSLFLNSFTTIRFQCHLSSSSRSRISVAALCVDQPPVSYHMLYLLLVRSHVSCAAHRVTRRISTERRCEPTLRKGVARERSGHWKSH